MYYTFRAFLSFKFAVKNYGRKTKEGFNLRNHRLCRIYHGGDSVGWKMSKVKRISRSASTGKYVNQATVQESPETTVTQTVKHVEAVRVFADGREMAAEIKNGRIELYGDEVAVEVHVKE